MLVRLSCTDLGYRDDHATSDLPTGKSALVATLVNDGPIDIHVTASWEIATGRDILGNGLRQWGCSNIDDVVLVFSELVTNALVHTAAATSTTVITHLPPGVSVAVHDGSPIGPDVRFDPGPGGFGLRIVSELSDSWGWDLTASGKVVWSMVPCGH